MRNISYLLNIPALFGTLATEKCKHYIISKLRMVLKENHQHQQALCNIRLDDTLL